MVLVVTVIATVIVYFVVLDTQNVGTLFLLFFLIFEFGISMIMFAFIFTTLFSNAKVNIDDLSLTFLRSPHCFKNAKKGLICASEASNVYFHTGAKILNFSKRSHFENLIFHKIHNFKVSFFTKFTI